MQKYEGRLQINFPLAMAHLRLYTLNLWWGMKYSFLFGIDKVLRCTVNAEWSQDFLAQPLQFCRPVHTCCVGGPIFPGSPPTGAPARASCLCVTCWIVLRSETS